MVCYYVSFGSHVIDVSRFDSRSWLCLLFFRLFVCIFFFFKHKTSYEMRISDWSSDVCSSDLQRRGALERAHARAVGGSANPEDRRFMMDRYRRAFVDRSDPKWSTANPELSKLSDAYEAELRARGLIDYEDIPIPAVRAMIAND